MTMPILLKRDDQALPKLGVAQSRMVFAGNGLFLERNQPMFSTSVRIPPGQLSLADHHQYCVLHCAKIPRTLHRAMLSFFRFVFATYDAEAALVLLYNPDVRRYRWHCPKQWVHAYWSGQRWCASDTIEYDNPWEVPEGYLVCGDAHLHPGPANPSSIDVRDEQDGVHIIVGGFVSKLEYNLAFSMDGVRFRIPPEMLFEDPDCEPFSRPPPAWIGQFQLQKTS